MIRIDDLSLADDCVAVHERRDLGPGLPARTIRITGAVGDAATPADLESRLDDVARAAAGGGAGAVMLCLRPGRRIAALLQRFDREVHRTGREAVFAAVFTSSQELEEADSETRVSWPIESWGAALSIDNEGTAPAEPRIELTAQQPLLLPAFDDGVRRLAFSGTMNAGQVLVIDCAARIATLDGADVTSQMDGDCPQLAPGVSALRYYDDFDSSHQGAAAVTWRARWW